MAQLLTTSSDQTNIFVPKVRCWKNSTSILDKPISISIPPEIKKPPLLTYLINMIARTTLTQIIIFNGKANVRNQLPAVLRLIYKRNSDMAVRLIITATIGFNF